MEKICKICKKPFKRCLSHMEAKTHYCSLPCYWISLKGRKLSKETRKRMGQARLREKNPKWKGGQFKTFLGYVKILKPEHPFANSQGYVREHRLVMEKHLGRFLKPKEVIHHLNGIRDDNRIENLIVITSQKHTSIHKKGIKFSKEHRQKLSKPHTSFK